MKIQKVPPYARIVLKKIEKNGIRYTDGTILLMIHLFKMYILRLEQILYDRKIFRNKKY